MPLLPTPLHALPPSLPCTTINVTSLKGCRPRPRPAPTPLVLHRLPLTSILSPRLFPSHPLILVLGIRWWGHGEQEVVPGVTWGTSRVLLYQCLTISEGI